MTYSLPVAVRNAQIDAFTARLNGGTLKVYAGAVPADADTALTAQVLLGTLTFSATAFPAASGGSASANPITQDSAADATGTATFFRAFSSGGVIVEQGAVGTSGAELNLNTTSIVLGGPIVVSSAVRSM